MDTKQAYAEIKAHIDKCSHRYSDWYAGITSDIQQRLHGDHAVPKKDHWFAHRTVGTADGARSVEKALIDLGCDGGGGGGDKDSKTVYAYLKTSQTNP